MAIEIVYLEKTIGEKTYKNFYIKHGEALIGINPAGSWEKGKNAYAIQNLRALELLAVKLNDKE